MKFGLLCEPSFDYLQTQQTPNPAAQLPVADPPRAEHSPLVRQVLNKIKKYEFIVFSCAET